MPLFDPYSPRPQPQGPNLFGDEPVAAPTAPAFDDLPEPASVIAGSTSENPIDKTKGTEEITQYHPIKLTDPSTWKDVPAELKLQFALLMEPDKKAQFDIVKNQLPEGYDVEWDDETAQAFVRGREGEVGVVNKAGPSWQDATQIAGMGAAFTPAARMGMGAAPLAAALRGGTAAATTEAGRQVLSNAMGAETRNDNVVPGINLPDVGLAAVTQAVPDAAVSHSNIQRYGPVSEHMANFSERMGNTVDELAQGNWLNALRGQVSEAGPDGRELKVLSEMPHSAPEVRGILGDQNAEALERTGALLEDSSTGVPGINVKRDLDASRAGLVQERYDAANPLYEEAWTNTGQHDTGKVVEFVNEIQNDYGPETEGFRTLAKIKRMIGGQPEVNGEMTSPDTMTLKQLHNARIELSDMIEEAGKDRAGGRQRQLLNIRDGLDGYLENVDSTYDAARNTFKELSVPINIFDESLAGKVVDMDDEQLFTLGKKIFNPNVSPSARQDVKSRLDAVNPETWPSLARMEMQARLGRLNDVSPDDLPNVPYQILKSLFPNEQARQMWKEALPDQAGEIEDLYRGLSIYSRNRRIGSDTASNQQVRDKFGGTGMNSMKDLGVAIASFFDPVGRSLGGINDATGRARQLRGVTNQRDLMTPLAPPGGQTLTQQQNMAQHPVLREILELGRDTRSRLKTKTAQGLRGQLEMEEDE